MKCYLRIFPNQEKKVPVQNIVIRYGDSRLSHASLTGLSLRCPSANLPAVTVAVNNYFLGSIESYRGAFRVRVASLLTVSDTNLDGYLEGLLDFNYNSDDIYIETGAAVTNRIEIRNLDDALLAENEFPLYGNVFPGDSKYYWKNAPALVADEVQDDPDVYKLICTPNNLQSDSIALYMAAGAGDPVLVETKPTATSIEFDAPIAELEAGTYTFTAVPVKGTALGIASTGVELVIPEPEPEPDPEPNP